LIQGFDARIADDRNGKIRSRDPFLAQECFNLWDDPTGI
jgi:hypothetical protein